MTRLPVSQLRRIDRAVAGMARVATARMTDQLPWFAALPAEQRSWVSVVVEAGIASFASWLRAPMQPPALAEAVFGSAPREMARAVTLAQTVEMVRVAVGVVESELPALADPDSALYLREAVLQFSREIAFAGAEVYARAAEERGAWDARLEALVVDTVTRGEVDPSIESRAAALGWPPGRCVVVLAGPAPDGDEDAREAALEHLRRAARAGGIAVLTGVPGAALVAVLGLEGTDPRLERDRVTGVPAVVDGLVTWFGAGTVVVGPEVAGLGQAGTSAAAALSALRASPAWARAGRVEPAEALLPERALAGDRAARELLVRRLHDPLAADGRDLLATAVAFCEHGGAVEATSRELFVHANTLRYRLRGIETLTGCPVSTARGRFALALALAYGRLDARMGAGS